VVEKEKLYVRFAIGLMILIVLAIVATLIASYLAELPIETQVIYIIAPIIAGLFTGIGCCICLLARMDSLRYWLEVAKSAKPDVTFAIIYFICLTSFIIYREPWAYMLGFTLPATLVYVLCRKYSPLTPLIYNLVYGFFQGYFAYYMVTFYSWIFKVGITHALLLTPYPQFYVLLEQYGKFFDISIIIGFFSILPFVCCEEMMFRHVLKVISGFGLFETTFATQMIFVVMHALTRLDLPLVQYLHTLVCIAVVTVNVFYVYYRTGSIVASIIAHNTYNTLIFGSYLRIVTPITTLPYFITSTIVLILLRVYYVRR